MKLLTSLLATVAITVSMPRFSFPDDILKQLWENDLTPSLCERCAEIAIGEYHRDGAKRPFILIRRSQNNSGGGISTATHLDFTNPRGDKYIIYSQFLAELGKVGTRQIALLPDIDPDRPRTVAPPMYEELRETNISPLFLTLSLHLAKKYHEETSRGEGVKVIVNKGAEIILPHEMFLRVEEREGRVSPVEVQMYRDGLVICTSQMKNAMVNGRLRPFWINLVSRGKTDNIWISFWGVVESSDEYFTPMGLGRGELSIPEVSAKVSCPLEICKK